MCNWKTGTELITPKEATKTIRLRHFVLLYKTLCSKVLWPGEFDKSLKGALEFGCVSLFGSSVKGTWRVGSLVGDPGG